MSYTPHEWGPLEVIDHNLLNNMEQGISNLDSEVTDVRTMNPAVMFFASDNNYRLAQYGSGQYEELEDYRVTVPASAVRMAINTSSKSTYAIVARKRETVNVALLLRQVQELQERVDELSGNT